MSHRPVLDDIERFQWLATFEAVARLGSFTKAAREMCITQPAVTRQMAQLEQRLGIALFERSPNRVSLTDAGQRLEVTMTASLDAIEQSLDDIVRRGRTFVLAAHPGIAQQWLATRLHELSERLDGLDVRLWLSDVDAELDAGGFDAALRVGRGQFTGQDCLPIFDEVVVPVASPAVAARFGLNEHSQPEALLSVPLVHMDDGNRPWMTWQGWFKAHGIDLGRPARQVLLQNYPLVVQNTLAGNGVCLGWYPLIDEMLASGALAVVGPHVRSDRGYYLTWPRFRRSEALETMIEWVGTWSNAGDS